MWSVIWFWKLKFSIFVCLFVYLFVCTSRFANFARGKLSNHDFKNCSEIRTVMWSVIQLWKLQFKMLTFFTPLQCTVFTLGPASPPLAVEFHQQLFWVLGHPEFVSCLAPAVTSILPSECLPKFSFTFLIKLLPQNLQIFKLHLKHRKNCECCPGHYLIVNH